MSEGKVREVVAQECRNAVWQHDKKTWHYWATGSRWLLITMAVLSPSFSLAEEVEEIPGLSRTKIYAECRLDEHANAATIRFKSSPVEYGESANTYPIYERDGSLLGAIDFDKDGHLISLELLDAKRQVPAKVDVDTGRPIDL